MKVVAIIFALCGVLSFLSLPLGIHSAGSSRWPLLLADSVFGIFLIWIAVGIWMRRIVAWRLGFAAIVLSAVFFVAQVCFTLPAVSVTQKVVILISCFVGGILVAAYWSVVWYRQKKWFSHDHATSHEGS